MYLQYYFKCLVAVTMNRLLVDVIAT